MSTVQGANVAADRGDRGSRVHACPPRPAERGRSPRGGQRGVDRRAQQGPQRGERRPTRRTGGHAVESAGNRFGGVGGMVLRPPVHERSGADDLRLGGELSAVTSRCSLMSTKSRLDKLSRSRGQSRSAGWTSGEYAGWTTRWTPSGTITPAAECQPAPSTTSTILRSGPAPTSSANTRSAAEVPSPETVVVMSRSVRPEPSCDAWSGGGPRALHPRPRPLRGLQDADVQPPWTQLSSPLF